MIAGGLTVREAASRLRVGETVLYEALRLGARETQLAEQARAAPFSDQNLTPFTDQNDNAPDED